MSQEFEPDPTRLEEIPEELQGVCIRLPVRFGVYVSYSDKRGGDTADSAEVKALEHIITAYAQDYCKAEFVQNLMNVTLEKRDEWKNWVEDLARLPDDCSELISLLSEYLTEKELSTLRYILFEIGQSVALAYKEDTGKTGLFSRVSTELRYQGYRRMQNNAETRPLSRREFLNISSKEQAALSKLSASLAL